MAIGNCCCDIGAGCEPGKYFGKSPLNELDFLKDVNFKFKGNIVDGITSKEITFPNFSYDVLVDGKDFWVAGGDYGAVNYSVDKDGEVTYNKTILNSAPSQNQYIYGHGDEQIWTGNGLGSRYGYEDFIGVYDVEKYKNYILCTRGRDGIYIHDKTKNTTQKIIDIQSLKNWGLETEEQETIFYKIKVYQDLLIIGTTGYDDPVIDFNDLSFDQPNLGIEFNYLDWEDAGSPINAITNYNYDTQGPYLSEIGLIILNINEVLYDQSIEIEPESNKERKQEELITGKKNVFKNIIVYHNDIDYYINHITGSANELLVSSGMRYENSFGFQRDKFQNATGVLTTLLKQDSYEEFSGTISSTVLQSTYSSNAVEMSNVTFLKSKIVGDYAYVLSVDYNQKNSLVYYEKNDFGFYNILYEGAANTYEGMTWGMCGTVDQNCTAYDPDAFGFFSVQGGKEGVVIDNISNPQKRIYGFICPQIDFSGDENLQYTSSKGTYELIAAAPTDFEVNSSGVSFTFWNGGYNINNCYYRSYVKNSGDCSQFTSTGKLNNGDSFLGERDLNEEVNMSFIKIFNIRGYKFLLDCIQFVGNGSGPGVYDPSSQSISPLRFSRLLKGFQIWSGVLRLKNIEDNQ